MTNPLAKKLYVLGWVILFLGILASVIIGGILETPAVIILCIIITVIFCCVIFILVEVLELLQQSVNNQSKIIAKLDKFPEIAIKTIVAALDDD